MYCIDENANKCRARMWNDDIKSTSRVQYESPDDWIKDKSQPIGNRYNRQYCKTELFCDSRIFANLQFCQQVFIFYVIIYITEAEPKTRIVISQKFYYMLKQKYCPRIKIPFYGNSRPALRGI
mgnify:CR=1 FL=1